MEEAKFPAAAYALRNMRQVRQPPGPRPQERENVRDMWSPLSLIDDVLFFRWQQNKNFSGGRLEQFSGCIQHIMQGERGEYKHRMGQRVNVFDL